MSGLSPELTEFVRASKSAMLPTDADSARIIEGLRARLGDAALVCIETAQVAAKSASVNFLFGKASLISLAGLAVLGGIWFFASHNPRAASHEAKAVASVESTIISPIALAPGATSSNTPTSPALAGVTAVANPTPEGDKTRSAAADHPRDRLAEEVALISRAEAALRAGKPAVALDVLNEHERKFGNGLLAEERIAARAQALRALGRNAEADAQLSLLSPNSLHGRHSR